MSNRSRLLALAAIVVVATGAFLALRPDEDDTTTPAATTGTPPGTTPTTEAAPAAPRRIRVEGGQPVGGLQKLTVTQGDRIRFTVTADAPEHVHLHGYDIEKPVGPGKPARYDVEAMIDGVFEIELEDSSVQLAKLTVEP